eukprot:COSAG06_NODE_4723_length_4002_cov_22.470664_4_plen_104_part_00
MAKLQWDARQAVASSSPSSLSEESEDSSSSSSSEEDGESEEEEEEEEEEEVLWSPPTDGGKLSSRDSPSLAPGLVRILRAAGAEYLVEALGIAGCYTTNDLLR